MFSLKTENFGELLKISKSIEISLAFCRRAMVFSPPREFFGGEKIPKFRYTAVLEQKVYKRLVFLLKRVVFRLLRSFQ